MTKEEKAIAQQLVDHVYQQIHTDLLYQQICAQRDHKDQRDKAFYVGGVKALEYQINELKALAESYGVRFQPLPERKLKLVVNNK